MRWVACATVAGLLVGATDMALARGVLKSSPGTTTPDPPFRAIAPTVARHAGDVIPSSARTVAISWTGPHRGIFRVTATSKVTRISDLLNSLPQEGRGQCSQGDITGPPSITFAFQARDGARLGSATEYNSTRYLVAWCVPTAFDRVGFSPVNLEGGGYFLLQARRILQTSLR